MEDDMTRSLLLAAIAFAALATSDIVTAQGRQTSHILYRTHFRIPTDATILPDPQTIGTPPESAWRDLFVPKPVVSCPESISCTLHITLSFAVPDLDAYEYMSVRVYVDTPFNLAWPHGSLVLSGAEQGQAVHLKGNEVFPNYPDHRHHTLQFVRAGLAPGSHVVAVQARLVDATFDLEGENQATVFNKVLKIEVYK
jgi:hypothetical protein